MASQIDFSRLRRQNLFPEIPDLSNGTMGEINFPDTEPNPYDMGGINLPQPEEPYFGGNYQVQNDPRSYVNPTIAGPGSNGANTALNLEDVINRIYTPETTSRDRFNRLLDAAPERESPSLMRGLAAFGMGMGAKDPLDTLKVHESVMYAPHMRNMADWQAKTQPFGQAAQFENTANINERTLAGNTATAMVNLDRYDKQNAINEEKNRIAEFKAESDRIRQEAYNFAQRLGKGYDFDFSGPTVLVGNKSTGDMEDSGYPTGKLSEEAKLTLQNLGKTQVAQIQGQNQMALQGSRNAGALAVQTLRNAGVRGNGSNKELLPSQQRDALFNKAQQWGFEHPEDQQFIKLDPSSRTFDVDEPSQSMFGNPKGMDPARYDEFIRYLYGSGGQSTTPSGMPAPPAGPAMPRGGGPTMPGQGQPQGQLTVPGSNDPRFQIPAGYDPHGRAPASQGQPQVQQFPYPMENQPAKSMALMSSRDPTTSVPPEIQAIRSIDEEIIKLKAQLSAPAAPINIPSPLPNTSSVSADDNSMVGQRFRQNRGIPPPDRTYPEIPWPEANKPGGDISNRAGKMEAGRGQYQVVQAEQAQAAQKQQIADRIIQLETQKQAALEALKPPTGGPVDMPLQAPAAAPAQQAPKTGFATNKQTGQRIPIVSYDGGVTWEPK